MKKSNLALAGGDPRVVAHPAFRQIPKCEFPLKTKEAKAKYDAIARSLHDAGRLTAEKHEYLSLYAMQIDEIHLRKKAGEPVRPAASIQAAKTLRALKLNEIETPISAAPNAQASKFARTGFANRRG